MNDEQQKAPYRFAHLGMIPECFELRDELEALVEKYSSELSLKNIGWIMQWVVDHIDHNHR